MDHLIIEDYRFAGAVIVFCALAVLLISWLLDKSPVSEWFKKSEGIAVSFITIPAFLFGLAISTIASGIWDRHMTANMELINESAALGTLISISRTLAPQDKLMLSTAINHYVVAVVDKEWPALKTGDYVNQWTASPEFEALSATTDKLAFSSNLPSSIATRLQTTIDSLRQYRLLRLGLAYDEVKFTKWPSIYVLSFLLLFSVGLLQVRAPRAMRIALTMGALCIGSTMVFLYVNQSPYRGFDPVQPTLLKDSVKSMGAP